jgi:hypothetical protein
MISHELAKELKAAAYPLRRIEAGMWVGPWPTLDMNPEGDEGIGPQHFYAPTLSELIDACGGKLFSLTRHGNIWQANWINGMAGDTAGPTPEEAVARLWLALNHK